MCVCFSYLSKISLGGAGTYFLDLFRNHLLSYLAPSALFPSCLLFLSRAPSCPCPSTPVVPRRPPARPIQPKKARTDVSVYIRRQKGTKRNDT